MNYVRIRDSNFKTPILQLRNYKSTRPEIDATNHHLPGVMDGNDPRGSETGH